MSDLRQSTREKIREILIEVQNKEIGTCQAEEDIFAAFKKMLPEAETNGLMIENIGVYLQGKNAYRKEVLERLDAK